MNNNGILDINTNDISVDFNRLSLINSYMIALVCAGSLIARIFNILGLIENGLYSIIVFSALIISIVSCMVLTKFKCFQMNKRILIFLSGITILFLTSYYRLGNFDFHYLNDYFFEFLTYGLILFVLLSIPFYYEKVIAGVSMLSLVVLINPVVIINGLISERGINSGDLQIDMGLSYALLPSVVAGILHFIFFRKQANFFVKISYLINLFLFVLLMIFSIRGVIFSLFILLYALIFSLIQGKLKVIGKTLVYSSVAILLIIIVKINDVILFSYNYLLTKGIEFSALTKSVQKMQTTTGLSNGRINIYENVIQLIAENPLLGKGISYYAYYSGGRYPHNVILQSMLETGILLTIPLLILILIAVKVTFSSMDKFKEYKGFKVFVMFCFVSSVPRLMFSSYLWKEQLFWVLLFIILGSWVKKDLFKKPNDII